MRHSAKLIFIFMAALSIAVLVTGCSSSSDNQITSENQNPVAESQNYPSGEQKPASGETDEALIVHFIDVGQADSILAQLPDGQNILIDAGNNTDADLVVNYLQQQGVNQLDYVIGTHPHEDHIGGLDVVIETFDTGKIYLPRVSHNTKTYEDLLLAIKNKDLKVTEAKTGIKLDTVSGVDAVFLAPGKSSYDGLNNYSAVLKLTYGSTSFLFTGDAEAESEEEMLLSSGQNPKADVLKVAHHGSSQLHHNSIFKCCIP